jgi:polyphosphate kinase
VPFPKRLPRPQGSEVRPWGAADSISVPMLESFPRTERFLNRELSWLEFNARVLALAEDRSQRLLERLKFLAIFGANLDEFFQVRVAGLQEQRDAGVGPATPEGLTPDEQLVGIKERVSELSARTDALWVEDLRPTLEKEGVRLADWTDLDGQDREHLETVFRQRVFPVLTPLSVDPAHPFPYISSLSLNLAALVRDPSSGERRFARVKVPPLLPRFVEMPDGERFVPIEQVIAAHLEVLFPGMEIVGHSVFRLTRDADFELEEDEGGDLLEAIESVLRRRFRGATPVRLELDAGASDDVRTLLMRELALLPDEVYVVEGLLDPSALWSLYELDRPELKDEPWIPVTQPRLDGAPDIFRVLSKGDLLVQHPYDSFETSVEAFIEQSATDPTVLAIKLALYRTSEESPIVRALVRAAEAGKQVVALVELKARFDERANIAQARTLEQAGVHVV